MSVQRGTGFKPDHKSFQQFIMSADNPAVRRSRRLAYEVAALANAEAARQLATSSSQQDGHPDGDTLAGSFKVRTGIWTSKKGVSRVAYTVYSRARSAIYGEFGTRRQKPRPVLRPALKLVGEKDGR